jgi:Protein of unknown function (DUF3455)
VLTFFSDLWILPPPTVGKILKYLTLGRGVITYECNSTNATQDTRPQFLRLSTELYDVAPLAQNLPNEDALHSLVPRLREYDYAELKNTSMNCVGRIYGHKGGVPFVHLFGFNVPEFNITLIWEIPPPTGPTTNGNWTRLATVDGTWEMYRVKTSGGAIPTSCKGHENSTIKVVYAAEYWFYHK